METSELCFNLSCNTTMLKEYLQKALVTRTEIGDREGEATDYGNLDTVFHSLGQLDKAKEYLRKVLAITSEIGHRKRRSIML